MSLFTVLIIVILVLLLFGGLGYSRYSGWPYSPHLGGVLVLILAVILVLFLVGRL